VYRDANYERTNRPGGNREIQSGAYGVQEVCKTLIICLPLLPIPAPQQFWKLL